MGGSSDPFWRDSPDDTVPVPGSGGEPAGDGDPPAIGKYKVLGCISRSTGQGIVYRAWNPDLEREVAIKLIRQLRPADDAVRDHFLQEGRILARIDHPGIGRIHDLGLHRGQPYLVLELIRGRNLEQAAGETRFPPRKAAGTIARTARSLAHLHAQGIVHRDLKPSNIVVDERGEPRIIDLGIAIVRDAWSEGGKPEGLTGTIPFMAPEQARDEPVGPPADIFSLGAVLYFLLTGKAPFWTEEGPAKALDLARRCEFDRAALAEKGIPRGLARICLRAMAADPRDRFERAEDFAAAAERWLGRARTAVKAGAALVLALVIGLAVWRAGSPPPEPKGEIVRPAASGPRDSVLRNGVRTSLGEVISVRSGDALRLAWEIPANLEAAVFWFGSEGKLEEMKVRTTGGGAGVKTVELPEVPDRDSYVTIEGPPGTEVIVLCLRAGKAPAIGEVKDLFEAGKPWPAIPAAFHVGPDGIRLRSSRGGGVVLRSPTASIRPEETWTRRLEALRDDLARRFDGFSGLAFPHS